MSKRAPKILAISLLVVIAVLLLVANSGNFQNIFGGPEADAGYDGDANNVENGSNGNKNDETNNIEPEIPPLFSNFPKQATQDSHFAFLQQINVDGEINLNHIINALSATYLVITSNSTGGDFNVRGKTVSVIRLNDNGTLYGIVHIETQGTASFLTASLTAYGLLVVVADNYFTYLNTFDFNLNLVSLLTLPRATGARVFPMRSGFLFLLQGANNTLHLISGNEIKHSQAIESGQIIDIFELNDSFVVFINQATSYRVMFLRLDLRGVRTITINTGSLLTVAPATNNGGTSVFLAIERRASGVFLVKYSLDYIAISQLALGNAISARTFATQTNNLLLLLETNMGNELYLLDATPRIAMAVTGFLAGVTNIYHAHAHTGGFYMLASFNNNLVFLEMRNDGNYVEIPIAGNINNATFIMRPNGNVFVFYTRDGVINIVGV